MSLFKRDFFPPADCSHSSFLMRLLLFLFYLNATLSHQPAAFGGGGTLKCGTQVPKQEKEVWWAGPKLWYKQE